MPADQHALQGGVGEAHGGFVMHPQHAGMDLHRDAGERTMDAVPGVVDQQVQFGCGGDLLPHRPDARLAGQVGGQGLHTGAQLLKLGSQGLQAVEAAGSKYQVGARAGKVAGEGGPEAAGGAGDEGGGNGELGHGCFPCFRIGS